jgi:hypothetical protein
MIEIYAFRTNIRVYCLFRRVRLIPGINLTLHEALIRYIMNYTIPACEFSTDPYVLKLRPLRNKVLATVVTSKRTLIRELHVAFKIPYVYNFITKLFRQQTYVIQNHQSANIRNLRQGEPMHKSMRLKLVSVQAYNRPRD